MEICNLSWVICNCSSSSIQPPAACGRYLGLPILHPYGVKHLAFVLEAFLLHLVSVHLLTASPLGTGLTSTPRLIRNLSRTPVGTIKNTTFHGDYAEPFALTACFLLLYSPSTLRCTPEGWPLWATSPKHICQLAFSCLGPIEGTGQAEGVSQERPEWFSLPVLGIVSSSSYSSSVGTGPNRLVPSFWALSPCSLCLSDIREAVPFYYGVSLNYSTSQDCFLSDSITPVTNSLH